MATIDGLTKRDVAAQLPPQDLDAAAPELDLYDAKAVREVFGPAATLLTMSVIGRMELPGAYYCLDMPAAADASLGDSKAERMEAVAPLTLWKYDAAKDCVIATRDRRQFFPLVRRRGAYYGTHGPQNYPVYVFTDMAAVCTVPRGK